MLLALYIGLAGAAGSISRYLVGASVSRLGGRLPYGTLAVNVVGSFAIGFVLALFAARGQIEMDSRARTVITVGFLGGFTTYSAFAVETVSMLEERHPTTAALYLAVTVVGAGVCCYLGILAGRALR